MKPGAFVPQRLELARLRAGYTKVALAAACGITPRSVTYYELGERTPSPAALAQLAVALDVPETFFNAAPLEPLVEGAASFRALTKMTAGTRAAALGSGTIATAISRWLEARLVLPDPSIPSYERAASDPIGAARRLRAEWELGVAPIPNVVHLLEAHGVRVFSLPTRIAEDVNAFCFRDGQTPIVLLNTGKTHERSRFDAAHELGHLVMHADYDLPRGRERELEANRFAAAFLMPEEEILAAGLRNAGADRLVTAKRRWGVSAMALAHRLHELGLTSEWVSASNYRRLSQLGYRSSEPQGLPGRETSQLLSKSLQLLRQRGVDLPEMAAELHLHPEGLRELLFRLAPVAVDGGAGASARRRDHLRVAQ